MRAFLSMTFIVLTFGMTIGCVAAQAQRPTAQPSVRPMPVQPASEKIMKVEGVGGQGQQPQIFQVQEKPDPLTPAEKSALTGLPTLKLIANTPFTLTAAAPIIPSRGALLFANPTIVNPQNNQPFVLFPSQSDFYDVASFGFSNRALSVVLNHLTAGKHYLIDCAVKGGDTYYVRVSPGDMKQTFSSTNHVVILYAAGTDYGEFSITAKTSAHWFFYSAEVTPLD
jgi:hypothetical protein